MAHLQLVREALCSVLFKAVMCLPQHANDNPVPKQLQVSSFLGVKPWKHLEQISRDCGPLNL